MKKTYKNVLKVLLLQIVFILILIGSAFAINFETKVSEKDINSVTIKITADSNIKTVKIYKKISDSKYILFYKGDGQNSKEYTCDIAYARLSYENKTNFKVVIEGQDGSISNGDFSLDPRPSTLPTIVPEPSPTTTTIIPTKPTPTTTTSSRPTTSSTTSPTSTSSPTTGPTTSPTTPDSPTVESVKVSPTSVDLNPTKTKLLKATVKPNNENVSITWSSSDKNIATVDSNGLVTAVNPGKCTITAKAGGKKATCTVNCTFRDKKLSTGDKVYFIDVESADCMLLYSEGKYAMIDTGTDAKASRVKKYLKDLGVKELEWVLITHFDSDHYGGYEKISAKYKIKKVYMKKVTYRDGYKKVKSAAEKQGTTIKIVGDSCRSMKLGNYSFKLHNLVNTGVSPYNIKRQNINSIVSVATVSGKKILFMGDLTNTGSNMSAAEQETAKKICNKIAKEIGKIDIYKVAHHGYNGNRQDELKYYKPSYAILPNNKIPKDEIANRIKSYTTGKHFYIDGTGTIIMNITSSGNVSFKKLDNNT